MVLINIIILEQHFLYFNVHMITWLSFKMQILIQSGVGSEILSSKFPGDANVLCPNHN